MICQHCGKTVTTGAYCSACGTHVLHDAASGRVANFAAHPHEHVARASLVSTLMPHLHPGRAHEFQYAVLGAAAVLTLSAVAGLVAGAVVAAAFALPALFVLYAYEHESSMQVKPLRVVATIVAGGVIGAVVMALSGVIAGSRPLPDLAAVTLRDTIVPVASLLLIVAVARGARTRDERVLDSVALATAAGIGFAAGESLARFAGVLSVIAVRSPAAGWAFPLVTALLLLPLMHAVTASTAVASMADNAGDTSKAVRLPAVALSFIAVVLFALGGDGIAAMGAGTIVEGAYQALLIVATTLALRLVVHHALLDAADGATERDVSCAHCGFIGTASRFCPQCGAALAVPAAEASA